MLWLQQQLFKQGLASCRRGAGQEKSPGLGGKSKIKKQNLPKRRAFPGKGFGSIPSKDPPYLRGKIFMVWEATPKEMLCPM